ncbi:MAG TPA: hypothetical protein VJC05_03645 [Candidatus Andersenbacteria bacterium]|nr:hypothetical protein [Candidatus Andersenbacteria bacterium]
MLAEGWPKEIVEQFAHASARKWRNAQLEKIVGGAEVLSPELFARLVERLQRAGTFDIPIERTQLPSGEAVAYARAADTRVWPMGTHVWIRDLTLIADRLLRAGVSPRFADRAATGKELLMSALTLMATPAQLKRMAAGQWPHIFLDSRDNLTAEREEKWAHKQDAWQMTALITLRAFMDGLIDRRDLTAAHEQFLQAAEPFLMAAKYWENKSSGSWEEIEEVRSSTLAWETALLSHLESLDAALGCDALRALWPRESATRPADAALIYLLQLNTAALLFVPEDRAGREQEILGRLATLDDSVTGGIYRYRGDSYQRVDFFRPDIAQRLTEYYGSTSGEASSAADFAAREQIVPYGRQAAWVHPVWQLSAWWGRRYLATNEVTDQLRQHEYFRRGLRLVTGDNEATVEPGEGGAAALKEITPWRLPECYITLSLKGRDVIVPSPHTPLNWAVAEAIDAFSVMEKTLSPR